MKTINISNFDEQTISLIEEAKQEDLLLKLGDGSKFIVSLVDDFDLEVAKTRQNQRLMDFLKECSQEEATISLKDVKQELGLD